MNEVRVDKWLGPCVFLRHVLWRQRACKKGGVFLLATPSPPPSRTIKVGDIVNVRKPPVTSSLIHGSCIGSEPSRSKLVPEYMENITPKSELDLLEVVKISGFIDRRKDLDVLRNEKAAILPRLPNRCLTVGIWISSDDEDDE